MIISHKHKYIFLHSRKCAGSSVKVALSSTLGSDDVMIGSWNEARDAGVHLNRRAKTDLRHPYGALGAMAGILKGRSISESINIGIKSRYLNKFGRNPAHAEASLVMNYCADVWDQYLKVSICRNPYERAVSDYLWRRRSTGKTSASFVQYLVDVEENKNLTGLIHKGAIQNRDIVCIEGRLVSDFVCRYENLNQDFSMLCEKLKLPGVKSIGRAKIGTAGKGYSDYYTTESIEKVSRIFEWEIDAFGYEYPY